MNALVQSFGFGEKLVRAMERDGEAWFVANDVCKVLEIANVSDAVSRLDDDERDVIGNTDVISPTLPKGIGNTDALGRVQELLIVSESGVYALIFRSRKPEAKALRKFVTSEVLPALRRTGRFEMPDANDDADDEEVRPLNTALPDEVAMIRMKLAAVKEARIAFGLPAARAMWAAVGLPDVREQGRLPRALPIGYKPTAVMAEAYASIRDWIEARCDWEPGHQYPATELWQDYKGWCYQEGIKSPHGLISFGKFLTTWGVGSWKSGRAYRVGLKLKAV